MEFDPRIDEYLTGVPQWQAGIIKAFRKLLHQTEPSITEEWKWSVPVFTTGSKPICAMSGFKGHVKINFFEGASLYDKEGLFNSGLDSKKHRSINLSQNDSFDGAKISALVTEALKIARS
jgi:hypothetical protein